MILIITTGALEVSVDEVIDWLDFFNIPFFRLNCEDIDKNIHFKLELTDSGISIEIYSNNKKYTSRDFNVVWFRKHHSHRTFEYLDTISNKKLWYALKNYLSNEVSATFEVLFSALSDKKWIDAPKKSLINKLDVLAVAKRVGIKVPNTIISNRTKDLLAFHKQHKSTITKPAMEVEFFENNRRGYPIYTQEVTSEDLEEIGHDLFPSLLQEGIIKEYELRVFYLNRECWAMAIFSQSSEMTKTDFRIYNKKIPNRYVPYKLPNKIEKKIISLMDTLNLKSGSLDFIKSTTGEYYFLEVNVVGQFGMVSKNCNYNLEKKLATFLTEK